jgi:2-polyprenyl-3-methyl-5-hydroxy-6-metoxy-1,4-benzoquinol methylase
VTPRISRRADVDRLIFAVGGGRVLCLGTDADALVDAFRSRAVSAEVGTMEAIAGANPSAIDADIVYVHGALDELDSDARQDAIRRLVAATRRAILVRTTQRPREHVEREWLSADCRKHPLAQLIVPYQGIDWERDEVTLLFEPLPADARPGRSLASLQVERELHMDMLREPGRRADAHVARYMLAREFIRPGDRVLDAACGLGYGSAILGDGTLAESVVGIDTSEWAVEYARAHYAPGRPRVSFAVRDVRTIADLPPASLDAVVSFETVEHIEDPDGFLAACRRVLTPAGRIICSVPNDWTNEHGVDPNPHHLHVFDRERLEATCRRHFLIEHVYGQTAGGGMKLPDAGRSLWRARPDEQQAEWWLAVGMTEPRRIAAPVRHGLIEGGDDRSNVLAFERDYDNPWLVRAMVTMGLRTESRPLLERLAVETMENAAPGSADVGAALCVRAYRHLESGTPLPSDLRQTIRRYLGRDTDVAHAFRWQVSLHYALAMSALQQGQTAEACRGLECCASADALRFGPHLATKTVGAAFLRGWIALQAGTTSVARHWWKVGIDQAERALHRPWSELLISREAPALFGLREAAAVVDLASQCAAGLALLAHAADRPGLVASQLFESLRDRLDRAAAVREPEPAPEIPDLERRWSLLDHMGALTLRPGSPEPPARWTLTLGDRFSSALLLHPPAAVEISMPTGAAGRLTTAVTIHPDAWGRPNTSPCAFSIRLDETVATTIVVDPHRRDTDRRWIEVDLDVPASPAGTHVLTLETRTIGSPDFGWALFRDPVFQASTVVEPAAAGVA